MRDPVSPRSKLKSTMRPAGSLECKKHEAISVVNRSLHPLGRPGLAHEVATAIAFLAFLVITRPGVARAVLQTPIH